MVGEGDYDPYVRPYHGHKPLHINISIYVLNIPEIDFNKHAAEMTLEMYFRNHWQDPRLRFDKNAELLVDTEMEKIVGGEDIVDLIWVPDTFFVNERKSEAKETFLKIERDGSITWSRKIHLTFTKASLPLFFNGYESFAFSMEKTLPTSHLTLRTLRWRLKATG